MTAKTFDAKIQNAITAAETAWDNHESWMNSSPIPELKVAVYDRRAAEGFFELYTVVNDTALTHGQPAAAAGARSGGFLYLTKAASTRASQTSLKYFMVAGFKVSEGDEFYTISPEDDDIKMGKSPIRPIGCPSGSPWGQTSSGFISNVSTSIAPLVEAAFNKR